MACEQIFNEQLRKRGFRLTPQREMILLALHQQSQPVTAEELYAEVGRKALSIELSTVYRTLELLLALGLLTVIENGEKQRRYHLSKVETPHLHLVCQRCGQVSGLELEHIQPLLDYLHSERGFSADPDNINIPGLCAACAASTP